MTTTTTDAEKQQPPTKLKPAESMPPARAAFDWPKISLQISIGLTIVGECLLLIGALNRGVSPGLWRAMGVALLGSFAIGYGIGVLANIWFDIASRIPKREKTILMKEEIKKMESSEWVIHAMNVLNTRHWIRQENFNRKSSGFGQGPYNNSHRLLTQMGVKSGNEYAADLNLTCPLLLELERDETTEERKQEIIDRLIDYAEGQWRVSGVSVKDARALFITTGKNNDRILFTLD